MDHFESEDTDITSQKENDPLKAREENTMTQSHQELINSDTKLTVMQQVGGSLYTQSQQPLKARNVPLQSQSQTQLLEKFRKLRQWQQQQQQSMLRQQQQAMDTIKMEQSQLQAILAAQKSFQEQCSITSFPLNHDVEKKASPPSMQNQLQQFPKVPMPENAMTRTGNAADNRELVGHTDLLRSTSSHNTSPMTFYHGSMGIHRKTGELPLIQEMEVDLEVPQKETECYKQQGREKEEEQSIVSFNTTLYPMMWNSTNYRLPIEAIPLSSGTQALQRSTVLAAPNVYSPMFFLGAKPKEMLDDAQSCQTPNPNEELGPVKAVQSCSGRQSRGDKKEMDPVAMQQTQQLKRLWSHNPGAHLLASVESEFDEISEADAMSGVYPLYDSESEIGSNEIDDKQMDKGEEDDDCYAEECEESIAKETTVIDLNKSAGKADDQKEESRNDADDEARPIKPGIEVVSKVVTQKPQRTFLRKGQGLARFKGKSTSDRTVGQPHKPSSQPVVVPKKSEKKTGNVVLNSLSQEHRILSVESGGPVAHGRVTRKVASKSPRGQNGETGEDSAGKGQQSKPSSAPQTESGKTTNKPKAVSQSSVFSRAECIDNPPVLLNSIDASFQVRLQELEEKQEIEEEELQEFELLEQAAANESFSSNSSVVVRVLSKARGNAMGGKLLSRGHSVMNKKGRGGGVMSPVDTGYSRADAKFNSSADQPELCDSDSEGSDITLKEMSLESVIEEGDGDEKSNQTSANRWQKASLQLDAVSASLVLDDDFDDEETWDEIKKQSEGNAKDMKNDDDDSDDDSDVTISDIFPLVSSTPPAHQKKNDGGNPGQTADSEADCMMASTPPTSALVTKLFPQLKPKVKAGQSGTKQSATDAPQNRSGEEKTKTGDSATDAVQSIAVRQKLKELETEIGKFRSENTALAKMRAEREEGLKKLQTEIATFEKQKTEELERLEQFKEEELKKLRRERRVFEKYQKAARAIPGKKERDEIEALRAQVAELQEELKRRESRWSAASTRSRQRIEALEQEKRELQVEIKLLEKYRLQHWREEELAKKPLQRKVAKTTEEASLESGARPPLSHRSPPLRSDVLDTAASSKHENTAIGSESRPSSAETDARENHAVNLQQDDHPSSDSQSKLIDVVPGEMHPINRADWNFVRSTEQSKTSPRRTSKTPDGSEKMKRNVRFQDEFTPPVSSSLADQRSAIEKTETQDQRREIMHSDGKIYYYSEAQTTHTTYPDGLEVLQFPSKQIEKHYPDGTKEITFPDQTIKYLYPNGAEECVFSDGTIQKVNKDGERTIEFPNGQREMHTKYYKKREYPDGTVKTVYPDGRTETRYATGRVRVKDQEGRVLVDSSDQMR
ncbi:Centromere protein J [Acropora cervicornis]|uniref:Centromere protein J n=1 Tax=Acropora cervicornis TaxID=6130 RepID=A0AAD9VHU3_ACRCE|nr:Centromere protein J [Acropora cervicornis]